MPTAKRIRHVQREASGGGGGGGTVANVAWGPDFGEGAGNDGITHRTGVTVRNPAIGVGIADNIGVQLAMPAIKYGQSPAKGISVHLAATAFGPPFWQSEQHNSNFLLAGFTSIAVAKPAGVQVGDLLIIWLVTQAIGTANWTVPGFTLLSTNLTSVTLEGTIFYRVVDGTEGATFTATSDGTTTTHAIIECHRIVGIAGTPINVFDQANVLATALDPDPDSPSVTTTVVNCLVMAFLGHDHAALTQSHTPAASHVERTDLEVSGNALFFGSHSMERVFAATGATGTAEHNCTETAGTNGVMARVAIAPGVVTLAP